MLLASATIWTVFQALAVTGGCAVIALVAGACVLIYQREQRDRPLIPWGARMRVERQKAHTAILQEQLKQDAVEVKRLALDYQRDQVLGAIKDGDTETVMALGLPSGEKSKVENGDWAPTQR